MGYDELSYFLYMESEELKNKPYEELTEEEKVNLELNPFLEEEREFLPILSVQKCSKLWKENCVKEEDI